MSSSTPSDRTFPPTPPHQPQSTAPTDPLRRCILATVALLGWLAGPVALLGFAGFAAVAYWRARRAGLTRSDCLLGDTRLVLGYLGVLIILGAWGVARMLPWG